MKREVVYHWDRMQRSRGEVAQSAHSERSRGCWRPNVDVFENEHVVIVRVELAGVPIDHLTITLEQDELLLEGVRDCPCRGVDVAPGTRCHQMEIEVGSFARAVHLPCVVQGQHVKATMCRGLLTIVLPCLRGRGVESRKIEVTT